MLDEAVTALRQLATEIAIGLMAGGAATLLTLAATRSYNELQKRLRLRHVTKVLGPVEELRGRVMVVLSAFEPVTHDEFAPVEITHVYKRCVGASSSAVTSRRKVPLYSDVITVDEHYAYSHIEGMLSSFGYSPVRFEPDGKALRLWDCPLMICLGGPRSNQKLRQVLNAGAAPGVSIQEEAELISDHFYSVAVDGREVRFQPSNETAYGFILKVGNPKRESGSIIAVAGDTAYSTEMAARYLAEKTECLAERFGAAEFFLVLESDRDSYETVRVATGIEL